MYVLRLHLQPYQLSICPSLHQCVTQVVCSSDVDHLRQVGVLAQEQSVLLAHEVAVVHQLLVEEVELALGVEDAHAGLRGEDLAGLGVEGERGGLEFDVHAGVEDTVGFGPEDEGVRGCLEVNDLLALEQLIMGLREGLELEIAHHERVGPSSEHSAVVDSPAVQPSIIQQQDDEPVNGRHFLHLRVSLLQQFLHFFNNNWGLRRLSPEGEEAEPAAPGVEVSVVAEGDGEVPRCLDTDHFVVIEGSGRDVDGDSRFRGFGWYSESAIVPPGVDCSIAGEGQGVARSEAEGLDLNVGLVEGDASGQLGIIGGGLSQSSVVAEADGVDRVILGEEAEVVLAS